VAQPPEQPPRIARERARERLRQVGLEHVAGADVLDHRGDAAFVVGAVRVRALILVAEHRPVDRRLRELLVEFDARDRDHAELGVLQLAQQQFGDARLDLRLQPLQPAFVHRRYLRVSASRGRVTAAA